MFSRCILHRCETIRTLFTALGAQSAAAEKARALIDLKHAERTAQETKVLHDLNSHEKIADSLRAIHAEQHQSDALREGVFAGLKLCTNLFLHAIDEDILCSDSPVFVSAAHKILLESHKSDPGLTRCALHALFHHFMLSPNGLTQFTRDLSGDVLAHAIAREYAEKIAKAKDSHDETFDPQCRGFVVPQELTDVTDYALSILLLSITRTLDHIDISDEKKTHALRTALHCLDVLSECPPDAALQHKIWEFVHYGTSGSLQVCAEAARWFTYQRVESVTKTLRVVSQSPHTTAQEMFFLCIFHVFAVFTGDRVGVALDENRAKGLYEAILLSSATRDAVGIVQKGDALQSQTIRTILSFLVNMSESDPLLRSMYGLSTIVDCVEKSSDVETLEKATHVLWNVLNHPDGISVFKELGCEARVRRAIARSARGDEAKRFREFVKKLNVLFGEKVDAIGA